MTLLRRSFWLPLVLAALAAPLSAQTASAQTAKPVAVLSIASVEKNLADVVYLTKIVGMEDTGKTAQLFGNALTAGMDKTRPSGLLIVPSGANFQAIAFVPVTNLKLLLEVHKEQVGEPKDIGGSILEIGTDRKAFIKEQAGWAFVAEQKEHLSVVPADPTQLLGDLPSKYNVAARVFMQNIPASLKQMAIEQIKQGMNAATAGAPGVPGQPAQPNQAQMEAVVKQLESLINEADEITVGLAVSPPDKSVSIDFAMTARDGTELAKRMALQSNLKSSFTGMVLPEAAISGVSTVQLTENDLALAKTQFKAQRDQAVQQLETLGATLSPEQKESLKKLVGHYLDLAERALNTRQDSGFAVVLAPRSVAAVAGGYVPDNVSLDASVKEFADFLKANPDAAGITFTMNSGTLGDLTLHRGSIPLKAEDAAARAVFGDKLEFVVGTGKNSFYLAGGKDHESLLKKVIERSATQAGQPAQPMQMTVAVLPIMKFYQSVDQENPLVGAVLGGMIASLEQDGSDKLLITGAATPKSATYRVEVQEGLIRSVGEVVKMFSAQLGGGLPQ